MKKLFRPEVLPDCFRVRQVLVILYLSLTLSPIARDLKYPVSAIPPELLKNADMVVRLNETMLEINSITKAVEKVHLVFTVFRESAREKAALMVFYDKDSRVINLEGRIYDAQGRQTDSFRSSDIIDQSAVPSGTLYSDDRVKYILPVLSHYPYTVEYEFERSSRQLMHYPRWNPVDDYHVSVEFARLCITAHKGIAPRVLTKNFPEPCQWPAKNSDSTLTWELHDFPALISEPLSAGSGWFTPSVLVEPALICIPGQTPELATWGSYGKWIEWLNSGRGTLPEQLTRKISQLTSGLSDPLSKMKAVYLYFQENTRYVSVQIGIGGYQPEDASFVAQNGYGDCKALANYLKALLESAGIRSYYTLVRSGVHAVPLIRDFPSLQFNHAILCVPMEKDTIWLECTSQVAPFGFLGSFTDDREVLIVTPGGGVIAHTPVYPKAVNMLKRNMMINLDSASNARICVKTVVTGLQYELIENNLNQSPEEQRKNMREKIGIPTINITQLKYLNNTDTLPEATEILDMTIPAYATMTGDRMFIPLNTINREHSLPPLEVSRNLPFSTGFGATDIDSVFVHLPQGFMTEKLPEPVSVNAEFGQYSAKVIGNNADIIYVRRYVQEGGDFPPEAFTKYVAFIKQLAKADRCKVVLKKSGDR